MNTELLDQENFLKAKNGDIEAFGKIILKYEKLFYNISYRMLNNQEDAKDVTQESLIKIYKNLDRCIDASLFKSWACKITTNTCIDYIRSKKRKPTQSLDEKMETGEVVFENDTHYKTFSPEETYIKSETQKEILKSIEELKSNYKTLIVLRDFNGLSYTEIALITNSNLGTVKSRLSRARDSLKQILLKNMELKKEKFVK